MVGWDDVAQKGGQVIMNPFVQNGEQTTQQRFAVDDSIYGFILLETRGSRVCVRLLPVANPSVPRAVSCFLTLLAILVFKEGIQGVPVRIDLTCKIGRGAMMEDSNLEWNKGRRRRKGTPWSLRCHDIGRSPYGAVCEHDRKNCKSDAGPLSGQRIEVLRPNDDIHHPRLRGGFWVNSGNLSSAGRWPKPLFLSIEPLLGTGLAEKLSPRWPCSNPGETGQGSIAVKQSMCPATKSPTVP